MTHKYPEGAIRTFDEILALIERAKTEGKIKVYSIYSRYGVVKEQSRKSQLKVFYIWECSELYPLLRTSSIYLSI